MMIVPDAPILTAEHMRAAEQQCAARGMSLWTLMERAGCAVADTAWRMAAGRPIFIICGNGNNGGDGYIAARILADRGAQVTVIAPLGEPKAALAMMARADWRGAVLDGVDGAAEFQAMGGDMRPVLVDALFGVGVTRAVGQGLREALTPMRQARILSVDVPSGVDADGAQDWEPLWQADVTIALGALKPAHVLQPSAARCGRVVLADLGEKWPSDGRTIGGLAAGMPRPSADAHKFQRGMVLVASGPMRGAAALCAGGAMRAGAGYVVMRGAGDGPMQAIIAEDAGRFSARYQDRRVGALVLGVGYPDSADLRRDADLAWASGLPLVLDAAGIDAALGLMRAEAGREDAGRRVILTPHEGEFQRCFGDLSGSKIDRARQAAVRTGAVLVYKGADMIIAAPDGRVCAAWPGSPWLASAGTGDVLAGACAAMLARGGDVFQAAVDAARWHISKAQRIGPGLIADDLIRN